MIVCSVIDINNVFIPLKIVESILISVIFACLNKTDDVAKQIPHINP